jgi:acyl-CoA thioesterase FadM
VTVERRLEAPYRVRFDECGADGLLRSSGFQRYAQDVAWFHSESAGFDRPWYRARGLTWLVRCTRLEILAPVWYGEILQVSTQVIGWRRVWARRESEFRDGVGHLAAAAVIDWVLLGPTGGPVRVPAELAAVFTEDGVPTFLPLRVDLGPTPEAAHRAHIPVRPRDLDPMGHVNNAIYLDYIEEALSSAGPGGPDPAALPRRYDVEYLLPAGPNEELDVRVWRDAEGWACRASGASGTELFRARMLDHPGDAR